VPGSTFAHDSGPALSPLASFLNRSSFASAIRRRLTRSAISGRAASISSASHSRNAA